MQLITIASAAAVFLATSVQADMPTTKQLMAACDTKQAYAKIVNRCPYDVYIWSVLKNAGCGDENMMVLKQGGIYQENLRDPVDGAGISIKISKTQQCKGNDITQLEYFMERNKTDYLGNYLDVSYVDCLGGDCPTMKEGYYLKAGDQASQATTASAGNTICPVLSCHDPASCSKISYVLPDDVQTRTCGLKQNLEYYMCGGQAPSGDDYSAPVNTPKPQPRPDTKPSSVAKPDSSAAVYKVNAAAVTQAPELKESKPPKVKTNIVYVTEYKYVNAKRHAHGHARRHQNFHA